MMRRPAARTMLASAVLLAIAALPPVTVWAQAGQASVAQGGALSPDATLAARIAAIRAMPPAANLAQVGAQRVELNAAWRLFGIYRDDAVPLLRRELSTEVRAKRPSPQFLLDAASFLLAYGSEADRGLALQAALALPLDAALDGPQLFRLVHAAAASRDQRLLPLIDRAFLRNAVTLPLPQQGSSIDENGLRVLLYGRFGADGERHLRPFLRDEALVKPVLDVLLLIGGPDSLPAVLPLLQSADMEVFTRAVNFLMRAGGPEGRQALLALPAQGLSKEAFEFLSPLREQLARQPAPGGAMGPSAASDSAVRGQLDALERGDDGDAAFDPAAVLRSALPKQELLERLSRIRERSLARATNDDLALVETTAALINAVRYREH
ncbi:hypothetical protein ABT364_04535 [Massilia sp. SR12]